MATASKKNMKPTQPTKQDTLLCNGCGKQKSVKSNFYKSSRKEYDDFDGYCNICKNCLSLMLLDISTNKITIEKFKKVCAYIDKPFILLLYNEIISSENITYKNIIGEYISRINLKKEWKNLKYSDSIMFELQEELNKIQSKFEVTDDMRMFWGYGLETNDYEFLQGNLNKYMPKEKNITPKELQDYKSLCIYELQKSKIQYDLTKIADVQKLQGLIDTLSNNLGIQVIQKLDENSNDRLTLGLIARYHEDIKRDPIRRWKEDLGNEDLIDEKIKIYYLGGILQAMKIHNPNEAEYKKVIEPHTVKQDNLGGEE